MFSRWQARHHGVHSLGIMLLISSLAHTPLPQPDFHNIRHHDGPGEVCEHHDHLLRWHPAAGRAEDVAVLHWHWFLPTAEPLDQAGESAGPAVHAHVADWQASTWDDDPLISAGTEGRTAPALAASSSPGSIPSILPTPPLLADAASAARRIHTFGATFAPAAPLACLYQRWDC